MTTQRGRGRPSLTDEQAWWSLRKRVLANLEEIYRPGNDSNCFIWLGPPTMNIAGKRGVISPANFILADVLDKDLCKHIIQARTCNTRNCLEPNHWIIFELPDEEVNNHASWHLHPTPGLSPEEVGMMKIAEAKAKARANGVVVG